MDHAVILPLGAVRVHGVTIPLVLDVKLSPKSCYATAKLPDDYPDSPFSRVFKKTLLVEITMELGKSLRSVDADDRVRELWGLSADTPVIYIHEFYGVDPSQRRTQSEDEQRAFRGMARKALCAVLGLLDKSVARSSVLYLMACGSVCPAPTVAWGSARARRSLVRKMVREHPRRRNQGMFRGVSNATLAERVSGLKQNKALERMYNRSFGFKLVMRILNASYMAVPLATALRTCQGSA